MKTEKNILIAFVLNFFFSIFELFGGLYTGSVSILSDALHDMGDALGIGLSFFLEKKSKKRPDAAYTYGYARYSVLGSVLTTLILISGSLAILYHAVYRIIHPAALNYNGMLLLAVIGSMVNLCAAFFTRGKGSLNQKAVNLHMLEDTLGWFAVFLGAVIMKFTNFILLDSIISIGVTLFILVHAVKHLKESTYIFLEKVPSSVPVQKICDAVQSMEEITKVHHVHIWSLDGQTHLATMHLVTVAPPQLVKEKVRAMLRAYGITHVTLELDSECAHEKACTIGLLSHESHTCHHHHHGTRAH